MTGTISRLLTHLEEEHSYAAAMRTRGRNYSGSYGAAMVRDADRDLARIDRIRRLLAEPAPACEAPTDDAALTCRDGHRLRLYHGAPGDPGCCCGPDSTGEEPDCRECCPSHGDGPTDNAALVEEMARALVEYVGDDWHGGLRRGRLPMEVAREMAGAVIPVVSRAVAGRARREALDVEHLERQREWSRATFGPGPRAAGVVDHIRKELREIEADPTDLTEWVDVVILALDGAWRAGYDPEQIIAAIKGKQARNEARTWPDWRTQSEDRAIEHDRTGEALAAAATDDTV